MAQTYGTQLRTRAPPAGRGEGWAECVGGEGWAECVWGEGWAECVGGEGRDGLSAHVWGGGLSVWGGGQVDYTLTTNCAL